MGSGEGDAYREQIKRPVAEAERETVTDFTRPTPFIPDAPCGILLSAYVEQKDFVHDLSCGICIRAKNIEWMKKHHAQPIMPTKVYRFYHPNTTSFFGWRRNPYDN